MQRNASTVGGVTASMVLLCAVPLFGHAACSLKPSDSGSQLPTPVLETRDALFASLCDESFAELVVYPDPRLTERFQAPSREEPLPQLTYPAEARKWGWQGKTTVAYVVETDGSVGHVVVIQSSGHGSLDEAAAAYQSRLHYLLPGTLDGISVRVLATHELTFKSGGRGARLSAAFTDDFITRLGVRLVDLCNRSDFAAIYDDLDEAGRRRTPRDVLKQQLREYNGLYGQITAARYEGLLWEETVEGGGVYELGYALDLDRPGAENVLLAISVAQKSDDLRMTSFWIDRRMTVSRHHHAGGGP